MHEILKYSVNKIIKFEVVTRNKIFQSRVGGGEEKIAYVGAMKGESMVPLSS